MVHVSWRAAEGALFPEPDELLRAAAVVARIAGPVLLWFCIVDNHVHLVLDLRPADAPRWIGRLKRAFAAIRPGLAFEHPRIKGADDRSHLENLVEYVLRNPEHHGLGGHPALHGGNATAALLGCQVLPGFDRGRWQRHLPRWEEWGLAADAGVPRAALGDLPLERVRELGPAFVARAAAAMVCRPDLTRDDPASVRARAALVEVCARAGVAKVEVAHALGVCGRSRRRLASTAPSPLAGMLLRRLQFEDVVRNQPPVPRKRDRQADSAARGARSPAVMTATPAGR